MYIQIGAPTGSSFSYGIYDEQGKQIATSGRIDVKGADFGGFLETTLPQTVKLEPSKIYYTGYAQKASDSGPLIPPGVKPCSPIYGVVTIPTTDGSIPSSFDPSKVKRNGYTVVLPIALSLDTTPAPARQKAGVPKSGIRWIVDPAMIENMKKHKAEKK